MSLLSSEYRSIIVKYLIKCGYVDKQWHETNSFIDIIYYDFSSLTQIHCNECNKIKLNNIDIDGFDNDNNPILVYKEKTEISYNVLKDAIDKLMQWINYNV